MSVLDNDSLTESELIELIGQGELVPLLAALTHLTGDPQYIDTAVRPQASTFLGRAVAGSANDDSAATALAVKGLKEISYLGLAGTDRSAGRELIEYLVGAPIDDDTEDMLRYQLGIPHDQGAPTWTAAASLDRALSVAIIGAGMSGIVMARRLDQAGIPYTIFERNEDFGGVWHENSYPGCRVDTTNYIYSYSFATRDDWTHDFSLQQAVHGYLRDVANEYGVDRNVRFGTEVQAATFVEDTCTWQLTLTGPEGPYEAEFSAVVSAVGQLNRPKYPDVPGIDTFAGPAFHTARWDHGVDLTSKRVAIIGTGASAYQVVPEIAEQVGSLTVFQRSAPWMEWTPAYTDEVKPGLRWLFENVPTYSEWYRAYQFWTTADARRPYYTVDPSWDRPGSVSAENEALRQHLTNGLERQYHDRPDLLEKVIPSYAPYSKRLLRDNGLWAKTLQQPNVRLVSDRIEAIGETGIRTNKEHLDFDVIIYATGFKASEILEPVDVTGLEGRKLHDEWAGDPKAFMGIAVTGFPNLFCLYGPNTNVVVSSSLFFFAESAANFVMSALQTLQETGAGAVDCLPESLEEFVAEIDAASDLTAWGASDESTWYKGASGRVSQNWPLRVVDYWTRTRVFPSEKFRTINPTTDEHEVTS
ncbi:flavin-containing monooxygenase [Streptomyces sp. NBC_01618]|uniref:flavin-containing monooxygenase n=1 Tax=Streptomyces sp. NBC_01618 TaxID=2975900 RepID=UPI00386DA1E6|nr:NAD(P)/FAD-dependent oxidoreductase [Streptomyces sp. NBC_01618]